MRELTFLNLQSNAIAGVLDPDALSLPGPTVPPATHTHTPREIQSLGDYICTARSFGSPLPGQAVTSTLRRPEARGGVVCACRLAAAKLTGQRTAGAYAGVLP